MAVLRWLVPAMVLLTTGCADDAKVKALEARVTQLEEANKALAERIGALALDGELRSWEEVAFLRPGDSGYATVRYDLGTLTVKMEDIKPYANGSKVLLQFGNLTSARVDGLKATIEWGPVDAKGKPDNDRAKSREVTFSEPLLAGTWTTTSVVLDGIPPNELGFLRVRGVSHRAIGLRR